MELAPLVPRLSTRRAKRPCLWPGHRTNEWALSIGSGMGGPRGHGKWPIHFSISKPRGSHRRRKPESQRMPHSLPQREFWGEKKSLQFSLTKQCPETQDKDLNKQEPGPLAGQASLVGGLQVQ